MKNCLSLLLILLVCVLFGTSANAENQSCRDIAAATAVAVESASAKSTYKSEDCETDCELLHTVKLESIRSIHQRSYGPDDFVGHYLVTTTTMAAVPSKADYQVIYRSYDIGYCTILRVERTKGTFALEKRVLDAIAAQK